MSGKKKELTRRQFEKQYNGKILQLQNGEEVLFGEREFHCLERQCKTEGVNVVYVSSFHPFFVALNAQGGELRVIRQDDGSCKCKFIWFGYQF